MKLISSSLVHGRNFSVGVLKGDVRSVVIEAESFCFVVSGTGELGNGEG